MKLVFLQRAFLLAAIAAIMLLSPVASSSIELDPFTPVGEEVPLTHSHPAFGAEPEADMVQPITKVDPSMDITGHLRKMEATSNDVSRLEYHFRERMERNANTIYKKFAKTEFTPAPWPSGYWPIYEDGINHKWDGGNDSPAEKYAKAFGFNVQNFKDRISADTGIDSQRRRRSCKKSSDCSSLKDGSVCSIREGRSSGYCIPTWFGICHAWAPASILEPEPECEVTRNGVTFKVLDLKALMSQVYDGTRTPTVFTGARYNGDSTETDEHGRYVDDAQRDLGPGYFHIATTNLLGRYGISFVVDVTAGAEVWNQPVRSYSIDQMTVMTPEAAAKKYFNVDSYPFNSAAKKVAYVRMTFKYILEMMQDGPLVSTGYVNRGTRTKYYTYLLELDNNDNIIGGEWVGRSKKDHPDFLWFPTSTPSQSASTSTGIKYSYIKEMVLEARNCSSN